MVRDMENIPPAANEPPTANEQHQHEGGQDFDNAYSQQQPQSYVAPIQPHYDPNPGLREDYTTQPQTQSGGGGPPNNHGYMGSSRITKNLAFVKSIAGIINIVIIVLLFFGWIIMVGWRGHLGSVFYLAHSDGSSFFLFTTLVPFFMMVGYIIMMVLGFDKVWLLSRINWNLTVVINCALWAMLLIISCSIVARGVEKHLCLNHNCQILEAAAAFGFLSSFGMIGLIIYYFKEWKQGKAVHK